jgi:hypothetical protein
MAAKAGRIRGRALEELQRFRQILDMKIANENVEVALPKTMMVEIVDRAVPALRPVSSNLPRALVLIALGILLDVAGLLMLKDRPEQIQAASAIALCCSFLVHRSRREPALPEDRSLTVPAIVRSVGLECDLPFLTPTLSPRRGRPIVRARGHSARRDSSRDGIAFSLSPRAGVRGKGCHQN